MRKIICDRCGADISGEPAHGLIWMAMRGYGANVDIDEFLDGDWSKMDFCDKCMGEIRDFILSKPVTPKEEPKDAETEPAEAEAETEPEAEEKPAATEKAKTVKPKELDTGKIIALYKAGWGYKAIADELKSNVSAIGRIIRLAKEEGTL